MDRIDRLLKKARPRPTVHDMMRENNPWYGRPYEVLKAVICPHRPPSELPEPSTPAEHVKFNYALLQARIKRREEADNEHQT